MKTFLKIDFHLQIIIFFGYLVTAFIKITIKTDLFLPWFMFYFIVGGFQLVSYMIRICIGFWKDLFFKIYGFIILPIWLYLLLSILNFPLDLLFFIPVVGIFISPIMAIAYLFYCKENIKIF